MDARATVDAYARRTRERLPTTILPYWLRVTRDDAGGYLLRNDVAGGPARRMARSVVRKARGNVRDDKHLVSQARLVWVFAHAHHHGYGTGEYLEAAHHGRRFLVEHFRDPEREGYWWSTDREGRPVDDVKLLYGQSFVIYAFVELAHASGSSRPLADALALFHAVDRELHDDEHGGWREHADRDWSSLRENERRAELPFIGRKSANGMVHWLEATSALAAATGDADVRRAVAEALELCRRHVFPTDPASTHDPLLPDWTPDPDGELIASYGHNVEYAWLMLEAQDVLGQPRDWDHFHAYLDHTLRVGFDHERGGAYTSGHGDESADVRHKLWWVQCELMNALTAALQHGDDRRYLDALARMVDFVERFMTDPRDGVLLGSVEEDGSRRWPRKSGNWKAGYHDVRAAVRMVDAFAPPAPASASG